MLLSSLLLNFRRIVAIALCFSSCLLGAQQTKESRLTDKLEIPLKQLSINQGLSQGMINDIVEDQQGYLWVATKDGLNRYDGQGFKVFRNDPSDPFSIADNFIKRLYVDSKNRLWISTQDKGLDLFDRDNEQFIHFKNSPDCSNCISNNTVGEINEDAAGNIIVESLDSLGYNVLLIDGLELTPEQVNIVSIEAFYPGFFQSIDRTYWTNNLALMPDGSLWYLDRAHIYHFNEAALKGHEAPQTFSHSLASDKALNDDDNLLINTTKTTLYTSDHDRVLFKYDSASALFEKWVEVPEEYTLAGEKFIDQKERLWCWQPDNKTLRIDLKTRQITEIAPDWKQVEEGCKNHCGIGLEDQFNNYWVGTGGNGLIQINSRTELFKKIPSDQPLSANRVQFFRTEKRGRKAQFDQVTARLWQNVLKAEALKKSGVRVSDSNSHLTYDNGVFWIGGHSLEGRRNMLLRIDPITMQVDSLFGRPSDESESFCNPVFLDQDGSVWFSERYSKDHIFLYHFYPHNDSLETITIPAEQKKMQYRFISDWYQDPSGLWWFATVQGLYSYNDKTKQWQHFRSDPDDKKSLPSDLLLSVCPDPTDPENYLWIGTEGRGLCRINKNTGHCDIFDITDGLPNNVIYAIQADYKNNLWLTTNNGLCLYLIESGEVRVFTQAEGLQGNEFNRYEFSSSADGTLYFSGTNGMNYFDPRDFYNQQGKPSSAIINSLQLFNSEVNFAISPSDNSDFQLPGPIESCKELVFESDQDMITFGFTTLDLTAPENNNFKFKLEGLNEDWIETGTRAEATFTDLSPGEYTLSVLAYGSSNVWQDQPTQLAIEILPPWYGTWLFRIVLAALVISMLYALYNYRLRQVLRMEKMRNQIAQDLHDDIGSTLSSISLYSTVMQKTSDQLSTETHTILDKITSNISQMMESMNDIVWSIKADNDSFEHVVYRMRGFALNMTEATHISLHFTTDDSALNLDLNMIERKNIYLIFKEAINNAIKYADCANLWVDIAYTDGKLNMFIADDGKGFSVKEARAHKNNLGGNGLKGMEVRAKEAGATIGLRSEVGRGTEIVVVLR